MPDIKIDIEGKDRASGKIKGVTGSLITAQLAVEGIKIATRALISVTKESIKLASDYAEANSKLNTIFAGMTKEVDKAKDSIKGLSDKAVVELLGNTGDLLTGINFTKEAALDLSTQTQQLAVDLASFTNASGGAAAVSQALTKAYLGERESLKTYGIAISETEVQQKLLEKGQQDLTGTALKQAKAEATLAIAIEQSKNAIGDYERTSGSLANQQRELQNNIQDIQALFGQILLPTITKSTASMVEFTKSIEDFLKNEKNIATIGGSFKAIGETLGGIGSTIKTEFLVILDDVKDTFSDLDGQFLTSEQVILGLAGAVEAVKSAWTIFFALMKIQIDNVVNFIKVIIEAAQVVGDLYAILAKKKTFDDVKKSLGEVGEAVKEMATDYVDNIKNVVKVTIDQFKELPENAKKTADDMRQAYKDGYDETLEDLKKAQEAQTKKEQEEAGKRKKNADDEANEKLQTYNNYFQSIGSAAQTTFSAISDAVMQSFANQDEAAEGRLERSLERIDTETQAQLEALGLQDLTKSESLQKEVSELEASLSKTLALEDKKAIKDQIREKKDALTKAKIEEQAEKKKDEEKKKFAKREFKRKVEAFNTQKALDLVTAGSQMALGIASAAASGAQAGFPAALVMIPLLTTLVAAAGIASLATIGSKQPPSPPAFQEGVTNFGGGAALVGEAGPELVTLGQGSNVITNENIKELLGGVGGGNIVINQMTVVTNDPNDFAEQLIELRRFELAR